MPIHALAVIIINLELFYTKITLYHIGTTLQVLQSRL